MSAHHRSPRRWTRPAVAAAAMAGLVVVPVSFAAVSGATLGALSGTAVGVDGTTVSGCTTTGLTIGYTTQVVSSVRYEMTQVRLSNIDPSCVGTGKSVSAAVGDGSACPSSSCATGTTAITSGTSATITLSPATTNASAVNRTSIVFTG